MPHSRRWVIDTNVLVSAIILPRSTAAKAVLKAQSGLILASEVTRLELFQVIERERFDRYVTREVRRQLAAEFDRACRIISIPFPIRVCRDARDDKFIELAVHGQADAIITGDDDLLSLGRFREIEILTPAAYLERG